jgi:hypothetical protein
LRPDVFACYEGFPFEEPRDLSRSGFRAEDHMDDWMVLEL